MSETMRRARAALMDYYGSGYGRIVFVWLCQAYWVDQREECPAEMMADVQQRTAPKMRRSFH